MKRPSLPALLIAAIPFAAMCFSVSLWDRIYPIILGLPFNLAWLLSWIVLTSICMSFAYRIESSRAANDAASHSIENDDLPKE